MAAASEEWVSAIASEFRYNFLNRFGSGTFVVAAIFIGIRKADRVATVSFCILELEFSRGKIEFRVFCATPCVDLVSYSVILAYEKKDSCACTE